MKKLIMAATIALVAIGVNAATVTWGANKGYLYDGATTPEKITSGTAYLMYVTATYTQADLVSDFYAAKGNVSTTLGKMDASGALVATGAIGDNSRIAVSTTESAMASEDGPAYFVVFNDDMVYVSITKTPVYDTVTSEATVYFESISASSKLSYDANAAYSAAGWYAVPEPTSGLLMMVGCALLALKRKRA